MPLSYDDLIEPTIVRQVSKSVAYCRCTRSKNLPFCDGSHEATNITPHILEFDEPDDDCDLPLLALERTPLLRWYSWTAGQTQRPTAAKSRLSPDLSDLNFLNGLNDLNQSN